MALVVQSAVRLNPGPCVHFLVTMVADGTRTVAFRMDLDEADDPITDADLAAFVKVAARYHVQVKGRGFGYLVGRVVLPDDAPEPGPLGSGEVPVR